MKKTKKLSENETPIQSVLDALSSHIAILDENAKIVAVNKAWRKFGDENGLKTTEYGVGCNYLEVCVKAEGSDRVTALKVAEAIRNVQEGKIEEEYVEYPCHDALTQRWFQVKIARFSVGNGNCIVIHQNITARMSAVEKLIDSEFQFRSIIEQSSEGIALLDSDGRIIEWNAAEEKITGLSRDMVLGRFMWDVQAESRAGGTPPKLKALMKKMITGLLKTGEAPWVGKPNEVDIIRPDGAQVTIQSITFPIKHNHGFMGCSMTRDVTELKQSKDAQLESEKRFHTYVNYSPVVALIINQTGNFVDVNPQACELLGYTEAEFLKMNMIDLIPKGEENESDRLLKDLLTNGRASAEIRIKKKGGDILSLSSNAVVLPDGSLMILCNDITVLKQFQERLQDSESFLNKILDNIPSLISVKEAKDLKYFKVNRPFEKFLGYSGDEIEGKSASDFFVEEEVASYEQQDVLTLRENRIIDIPKETVTTKDLTQRIFHEKKVPMYDEHGNPRYILSIAEDVTEQVNLESEALARLARLEAVSKLSTKLQTIQSLDEMLPILLDTLLGTIDGLMGSIWLYKPERDELVPVYYSGGGHDNRVLVEGALKPGKGIPGMVYLSREPYITQNYDEDPWFSEYKKGLLHNQLGGITLPLTTTNSVIGTINISFLSGKLLTEEDVKLLNTLSEIAGNAIRTMSLQEQTEQRLMRLTALSSIDRAISSSFDLDVSLEILVSNVITQLKMDAAAVLLFNPHSQLLEYTTGQGFITNAIESTRLRLGQDLAGKAALSRELVYESDLNESHTVFANSKLDYENFITYYAVPLIAKGQLKGVLEVFNRTKHVPDDDWLNFLKSLAEQATIAIDNTEMFENLRRTNIELSMAYNATIEGWSHALDLRDKETEGHTQRVTEITERLAREFEFPEDQIKYIRWGALLHDIGKMGVPDEILLKPGPLNEEEWKIMRMHPNYAYEMLAPIGYLSQAIDIPYCHHEKWDGTGYPRGLSKDQIPLSARIFAVVDIWDALSSDRPYRKAWPAAKIIEYLETISGSHLDPHVVDFCLKSNIFLGPR